MEWFVDFLVGIWEENRKSPNRKWIEKISEQIKRNISEGKDFVVSEERL